MGEREFSFSAGFGATINWQLRAENKIVQSEWQIKPPLNNNYIPVLFPPVYFYLLHHSWAAGHRSSFSDYERGLEQLRDIYDDYGDLPRGGHSHSSHDYHDGGDGGGGNDYGDYGREDYGDDDYGDDYDDYDD